MNNQKVFDVVWNGLCAIFLTWLCFYKRRWWSFSIYYHISHLPILRKVFLKTSVKENLQLLHCLKNHTIWSLETLLHQTVPYKTEYIQMMWLNSTVLQLELFGAVSWEKDVWVILYLITLNMWKLSAKSKWNNWILIFLLNRLSCKRFPFSYYVLIFLILCIFC